VGDEGGFAPNIQDNKEGLQLLVEVCVRVRPCVYVCARACVHSSKRAPLHAVQCVVRARS